MGDYPGLREFRGEAGLYRLNPAGDDFTLDIHLASVPAFIRDNGRWVMSPPDESEFPDISFVIDNNHGYWSVVSLEVPSFGMDGVNEFLLALFQHQENLNQIDELLPVIQELLDDGFAVWGHAPADLEMSLGVHKLSDTTDVFHPGI